MEKLYLDDEEKDLMESIERGEWKSVQNLRKEIKRYQQYAKNTIRKDRRLNIRISSKDLENLQTVAIENGIPYQTFVSSILHKFLIGRLVEIKNKNI